MIKNLFMACILILVAACSSQKNEQYYRTHPQELQDALKSCPTQQSSKVSCEQLANIGANLNELAYQLQVNPQVFGKKILLLQEQIASQQASLKTNGNQPELRAMLEKNKEQLAQCIAIVRWLESPES